MNRFDALADQVAAELDIDDAILDGEMVAANETGRPVFIDLLGGTRKPLLRRFRSPVALEYRAAVFAAQRAAADSADDPAGEIAEDFRSGVRHRPRPRALRIDVQQRFGRHRGQAPGRSL
jgi:hypothetical protein